MTAQIYGKSQIGANTWLGRNVIIGYPDRSELNYLIAGEPERITGAKIGANCIIRDFTIIYSKSSLSDSVTTGHHVLIRELTTIGTGTLIGSATIIDGNCKIGSKVSIQSGVYIPINTVIEDSVFIGPRAVLTNDKYMDYYSVRDKKLEGPRIRRGAKIGANATLLPGVVIGENAVVGAGAVVTRSVEPNAVVVGVPARKLIHN